MHYILYAEAGVTDDGNMRADNRISPDDTMTLPPAPFLLGSLNREPITRISGCAHPVVRGRVHVPVHTGSVDAFIKLLPPREFAVESVCEWLAREVELPMPEPLWVTVHRQRMRTVWPFGNDETQLCFGTQAFNLARPVHLGDQSRSVLAQAYGLDSLLLAKIALFDELIGNDDRHAGNLLLTPRGTVVLIDHERALGGTGLALFSTAPPPGPNQLLHRVRALSVAERATLKSPLRAFCAACTTAACRIPYTQLVNAEALHEPMRVYLESRAERLFDTLEETLGIRDLPGLNPAGFHPLAP
ncbi:hypothetical protein RI103_02445 [Paraburkholderia sp. FT54]|uniref:HipA family kinase n=1 Tax=Paraburkholderia sp. FT54 TaxID=3074437 RepID=UPI002877F06F|nr:HipA family kinase [Paraburkholderia sp. FT54]WNC90241.1 hypothetical protein RI103_02445 [Paraburkholderia sp. FT54]